MKILAIRIKNLASLEGNTEIDFTIEPLSSAGIFAITGATGAGKSTILDALCLALYGKTPRYLQAREMGIEVHDVLGSTISQGDVRAILRDGTAEGYAEVDFVGVDGHHYRATWHVRRARNKAEGSIQPDSITLKNITSHLDIPGKKVETYKEIERLVGLNFEQFTRSVLLAQGDFTAFMKANKDEKSSLLEKLTGTHIYSEISKKIYEKYKVEESQLRDLHIRKEGIDTLSEEDLKTLQTEQTDLATQIKLLEKELEQVAKEINWHELLSQFQLSQNLADIALQKAIEAKTMAATRKQKLFLTEQVQKTRSWADALGRAQQQLVEKTQISKRLKEQIALLHQQKEILEKQVAAFETDLQTRNKTYNDALPQLTEAKKLDTLLSEKKEQLKKSQEELENTSKRRDQHQKTLTDKQVELTRLLAEIKTLDDWKTRNLDRRPIADNRDLIRSKLGDAHKLLNTLHTTSKELEVLQEKIRIKETEETRVKTNFADQNREWENLKNSYDTQSKALLLVPIEAMNLNKIETDHAIQNSVQAQAHWQLLYSLNKEMETLGRKQLKDQTDHEVKSTALQNLAQQLVVENTKKEASEHLLQQARLAATENVEDLRKGLVTDEPCPVCGSKNHPYLIHNPQLENVLTALETTHRANEDTYLSTLRQHSALEQECRILEEVIWRQKEEISIKKSMQEDKDTEWKQFSISQESIGISADKRADWITEKLLTLKTKQEKLHAQIQAHSDQKQQLEVGKNKIDQLKETLDQLASQIKDSQNNLALYREQEAYKNKEVEKSTLTLQEVKTELSPYFTAPDWMENWKVEPVLFLERINTFAQNWKDTIERLEQLSQQQSVLKATLTEWEVRAKNLTDESTQKTEAYLLQNKNHTDLTQQRQALFEGKAAEDVEIRMKQAITIAQQQLDIHREKQQQLKLECAKTETQHLETLGELGRFEIDIKTVSQKMLDWIADYNQKYQQTLNMVELQGLLLWTGEWIDAERNALNAVEEEVTMATSVASERKYHLEAHKQKSLSDRPLEDLKILNHTTKQALDQKKRSKEGIHFRLEQNEINKNKIGDLLKNMAEQEAITENWSKLNEIIGSADGKKFRQIAQEYTLDVLLGYANIHLLALTDRYKIERIPATLGLQVVDQDMGDEVRTVYSLSGGESFLVSLALALGLASLSSSRMKVESLFIDEGFGSLDPTTLNIAMDALERLHNQGRKVGVISHVQEMTERIPVQIKVSKMASGKSKVEVMGNYN